MATKPKPGNGISDPGLAAALAQALGGGTIGGTSLAVDPMQFLQQTLYGLSGRAGITSQPLVGLDVMPRWARNNDDVRKAVYQGTVDPYLPSQDPNTWQVFVGGSAGKTTKSTNANVAEANLGKRGDDTLSVSTVANQPYLWGEDQVADAIKRFQKAGVKSVVDFDSMQKAWTGLVQRAGAMYSQSSGQRKVTPWDVLDLYKSEISKAGTGGTGGPGGFTGTHTQVQKTISEISQGDAWAALRQTTQQLLGHDPDDQEVRDFAYRMNTLAAKSPSISTTTGNYQDGILTDSTTKTKAGFNSSDIAHSAYDDAQSDPDYAEYQSASTYFNAALSALGEIGA